MRNPFDMFILLFVMFIMIVGIYVSLNAQQDLRNMRYFDSPTNTTNNIG